MLLGRNKSSIGTQSNRSSTVCVAQVTWLSTCCYSSSSLASSALATKRPYDYMTIISRTTYLRVRRPVATLPLLNNSRMSSLYHHFTPASNAAPLTAQMDLLTDRPTHPPKSTLTFSFVFPILDYFTITSHVLAAEQLPVSISLASHSTRATTVLET